MRSERTSRILTRPPLLRPSEIRRRTETDGVRPLTATDLTPVRAKAGGAHKLPSRSLDSISYRLQAGV
jgi:hypothetical protein